MSKNEKYILLVEDNQSAIKAAQILFKMQGCTIDCASDGSEAIEMAMKNKYDAIYMDIGLPTISGVEACKAIRAYEVENHLEPVPIIAVTANNSESEIKQYLASGMQEVLGKPLTKDNVIKFLSFCK